MHGISVIVPARDEGAGLLAMVRGLLAGRRGRLPVEVVVVDDASSDGSGDAVRAWAGRQRGVRIEVVRLAAWRGIPFARNRGAERARLRWLLHTDANAELAVGWDVEVARAMSVHAFACGVVRDLASPFVGYGCRPVLPSLGVHWITAPDAYGGCVPVASCAATAIASEMFFGLGGYDESLPFYGAAEVEFSWRAWLSGGHIALAPGWVVGHRFRTANERGRRLGPIEAIVRLNYLRLAAYYLPPPLLACTLEHYARQAPATRRALDAELERGDLWRRRDALRRRLRHPFEDYACRFGLVPSKSRGALQ